MIWNDKCSCFKTSCYKNRTSNITCSCIEAAWVSHCSKHGNIFVTLSLSYENKRCLNKNNVISTAAHVAVVEVLMKCAGKLFSQEIVLNNLFISSSWFIWNHYQNSTLPRIYTNCDVLYFGIDSIEYLKYHYVVIISSLLPIK